MRKREYSLPTIHAVGGGGQDHAPTTLHRRPGTAPAPPHRSFPYFVPSNDSNFSSTFKMHSSPVPGAPEFPPPTFPVQNLLIFLPLTHSQVCRGHVLQPPVNLTSLPLIVSGPWGCSEVGKKKMELRRMEEVDGAWGPSHLIPISAFFQMELTLYKD